MTIIAATDAAKQLPELVRRAASGEEILITGENTLRARLVSENTLPPRGHAMSLEELREWRKNITLGPGLTIKQLIEEGRR